MDTIEENWRDESVKSDGRTYGVSDSADAGSLGLLQIFRDQPLLVIGLGLALGAILGFSLLGSAYESGHERP